MNYSIRGFLALLGTSLIYGMFGVIARELSGYLTANQMTFARALIVSVILFVVLAGKKLAVFKVPRETWLPLFVHSVTFGFTIFLFTYAVFFTTLSKATFSFYAVTLFASLCISVFVFKEGFQLRKQISFYCAVISLLFFILPTGIAVIDLGMILTGIAGITDVVSNSMKKYLGGKVDRMVMVFYQMITGVIFGAVLILFSGELTPKSSLDLAGVAWLLFFSLNFFLLSWLAAYGFQHFDLNLGTIILALEFVFASLFGYLLYAELMTTSQILSGVAILASIVVMNWPQNSHSIQSKVPSGKK